MTIHGSAKGLTCQLEQDLPNRLRARLQCRPGELLALVGPSGAGKTSLLRALAGLSKSVRGTIEVDGSTWLNSEKGVKWMPQQRRVGMVFQHYALMPHLSALDNVALALLAQPRQRRLELARRWLLQLGLTEPEMSRRPEALSGGQQQRVALARALVRQPRLLLLDEPFSAVDQVTRRRLYEVLAQLRDELGIAIVLVTHDLNEARLLANQLAVISEGEVLQTGSAQTLYQKPRTRKVADLIGIQNRFSGIWLGAHSETKGLGNLRWHRTLKPEHLAEESGPVLSVPDKGKLVAGQRVNWIVPGEALTLSRAQDAGLLAPHTKAHIVWLPVSLDQVRDLGEITLIDARLTVPPLRTLRLTLSGPARVEFKRDESAYLALNQQLIHIMPRKPRQFRSN